MRFCVILFLFHLVPTVALTAPDDSLKVDPDPPTDSTRPPVIEGEDRLKSMDISSPPKVDHKEVKLKDDSLNFYYPFRQAVSPRLGLVFDPERLRDNFQLVFLFGVTYLWPNDVGRHWETGFDIHTGGTGYFQIGKRYVFRRTEKLRPFVKPAISMRLKSHEGIASLVNQKNLQLRIAAGFEDLLYSPLSAAITLELAFGYDQNFLVMGIGYSWAW